MKRKKKLEQHDVNIDNAHVLMAVFDTREEAELARALMYTHVTRIDPLNFWTQVLVGAGFVKKEASN